MARHMQRPTQLPVAAKLPMPFEPEFGFIGEGRLKSRQLDEQLKGRDPSGRV
jgi:hypothetical protein